MDKGGSGPKNDETSDWAGLSVTGAKQRIDRQKSWLGDENMAGMIHPT